MPVTRVDVARRAGVSPSTVSRVVNSSGYVAEDVRQRVLQAIRDLNYVPNRAARSLRLQHFKQIACIAPAVGNLFYSEIVAGMEEMANRMDYTLSTYHLPMDRLKDIDVILHGFYDGLVFLAPYDLEHVLDFARLSKTHPLCVYSDRGRVYDIPHVSVDLRAAMRQSVEYLISLGHQQILFLGYEFTRPEENPRYLGYLDALHRHGLHPQADLVQLIPNHQDTISYGHDLIRSIVDQDIRFTAVTTSNDSMAVGALRALNERGLSVPHDISVVGMDDIELASLTTPPLTTTRIPKEEIGAKLVELLVAQVHGEKLTGWAIELPTDLVVRESTAAR
ncbi:MAG: LacI family transcriptional regulator [Alicyclobacillus sp.]|nr:LacI family transcriptional regulator [Alicyclobacillus sp.]